MDENIYLHPNALCESNHIGENTRVWAFAHILPGARIGKRCNICDGVFVENDVIVGDDVTLKCGVQLWDGIRLGNRIFVGPNATFTNDLVPRSKVYPERFLETVVEDDASIGANSTLLPGVRVGRGAMVGAGAVVTRDVPPYAKVAGNPAKIIGYFSSHGPQDATKQATSIPQLGSAIGDRQMLGISSCFIQRLPHFSDMRGSLTPLELDSGLPFTPARVFLVYGVNDTRVRGEHAHRVCEQFLVAVAGKLSVMVDDGQQRIEVELNSPSIGLYIAPMVWGVQYKFSPDAVLMVVASHSYDNTDYIRDYNEFCLAAGV